MKKINTLIAGSDKLTVKKLKDILDCLVGHSSVVADSPELIPSMMSEIKPDLVIVETNLNEEIATVTWAIQVQRDFKTPIIFIREDQCRQLFEHNGLSEPFSIIYKPVRRSDLTSALLMINEQVALKKRLARQKNMLRGIRSINNLIVQEKDPLKLIDSCCKFLVEKSGLLSSTIVLFDEDKKPTIRAMHPPMPAAKPVTELQEYQQLTKCIEAALSMSSSMVSNDPQTTCIDCHLRELHADRKSIRAKLEHSGRIYGIIVVSFDWDLINYQEEHSLFQEIIEDIGFALYNLDMERERKRAETALYNKDEQLSGILNNAVALIYLKDLNGKYLLVNQRFQNLVQKNQQEILGKSDFDIFTEEIAAEFQRNDQLALASDKPMEFEEAVSLKDGEHTYISIKFKIYDATGKTSGICGMSTDITERKRSHEALKASEEKYREHFQFANDVIYSLNLDTTIADISPSVERVLGYKPEELIGKSFTELDLLTPESLEIAVRETIKVITEKCPADAIVYEFVAKDGSRRWGEVSGTPLIRDGEVAGVMSVARDITDRKFTEDALKQSEKKFRLFLEQTLEGLWVVDADEKTIEVNQSLCSMLGYSESEIIGKKPFDFVAQENLADLTSQAAIVSTTTHRSYETVLQTKNGNPFPALFNATTIKDDDGAVLGSFALVTDLSEHQKAKQATEQLEEHLRQSQKLEAIGRLAGGVAHDFNNLLTVISNNSDMILTTLSSLDPIREEIEEICKAADRASKLTGQLLTFSRKQIIELRNVDINHSIDDSSKMIQRLIGEDIDLVFKPETNLGVIKADPGQLDQVLVNLSINARDAMPNGGKLTIETKNIDLDELCCNNKPDLKPGKYVMIAVSDSGCGMTKEVQKQIFEPFFTTKKVNKGTGLGLSTVYGIVKKHNGSIDVYSEIDTGTTFKIYLPSWDNEVVEQEQIKAEKVVLGQETILLIEDEAMVLDVARRILKRYGYQVLEASNGDEALSRCQEHEGEIDLVLTDVIMPNMSGRESFERLKQLRPDLKVLYMSGYTDDVIANHGILDQDTNFLQKPFNVQSLINKVRDSLGK